MLYLLTGDIQIGKTRWLSEHIERWEGRGAWVAGVIAPGIWKRHLDDLDEAPSFEKLGITNELLPGHEVVQFAWRRDIALEKGLYDPDSQAARADMGWHIDDKAIGKVDEHLGKVRALVAKGVPAVLEGRRRILVIDELGRLELLRDEGLRQAMGLLGDGPAGFWDDAIVVARELFDLDKICEQRFGPVWGGCTRIGPGDDLELA